MKSIRESKGISQNELARMAGVPQSVISDIESGKTKAPRIDTMMVIAKALGVSIDELVEAVNGRQTFDDKGDG